MTLLHWIENYGLAAVFLNVFLEQAGLPLPAYPTMVAAGSLTEKTGALSMPLLLAVSVAAALTADLAWYYAGRRHGNRLMALLCRISLSPDSCIRQTRNLFSRWGPYALLGAKFVPGFASLAGALAGKSGIRLPVFLLFDAIGSLLWAGSAVLLGARFSTDIAALLDLLARFGTSGLLLVTGLLVVYGLARWWQRRRFARSLRAQRISVEELHGLLQQDERPVVIDVRAPDQQREGRIPGALLISGDLPRGDAAAALLAKEVIVYCACPDEASAALVARRLMKTGVGRVRPLLGGIAAWQEAGYPVEAG